MKTVDGAALVPRPHTLVFPWTLLGCGYFQRAVPKVMDRVMLSGNRVLSSNPVSSTGRKRETISHIKACAHCEGSDSTRKLMCSLWRNGHFF